MRFFHKIRDRKTEPIASQQVPSIDDDDATPLAKWRNLLYDQLENYAATHHKIEFEL